MGSAADIVVKELRRELEGYVLFLATEIQANLVESTPVDTGWARANWLASVGVPNTSSPGRPKGKSKISKRPKVVTSYKLGSGGIWIANNVPYIGRLADGWSQQAPAGWVDAAIQRAMNAARSYKKTFISTAAAVALTYGRGG